jgi:DNA-binding NtrC family response regulator
MTKPPKGKLLIADDEAELKNALCETLADEGYLTVGAAGGAEALRALKDSEFDVLLSDLMMPGMDGIQLLRQALTIDANLIGIIMTGQGTIATAVEAMKIGAFDYVLKPFNLQMLLPVLARAMDVRRLRVENRRLRRYVERLTFESPRYEMIGSGPGMRKVFQMVEKVAPTDATVLIRGRSGTGKELVARALHFNSLRRDRMMVTINCATLQETLLESELFGHEKGSFTGAQQTKQGLIEVAEGGTLFIDEVAEMNHSLQAKLLRVLEDGHYRRVGGTHDFHADVRIIAATNKPLEEEQKAGRFREDLFYRLNVITIELPTLQDRREDIPALVEHLLTHRQVGPAKCKIDSEAMAALVAYNWPGNVRELANVLERGQILATDNLITLYDLPENLQTTSILPETLSSDPLNLSGLEYRALLAALEKTGGNKARAAKALGIDRRSLYRLLEKYHVDSGGARSDEVANDVSTS